MLDGASSGVGTGAQNEREMIRHLGLKAVLAEDFRSHRRQWAWPGLHALWVHRIGVYGATLKRPWRSFFSVIHIIGHIFCRNFYGIEIARSVQIGRRMQIAHQHGIIIHKYARFGDDCLIRQGVTLGVGNKWIKGEGPVIGNNVEFGVGAVILGNVRVGDNVLIGPNCVVMNDVPSDRSMVMGMPRLIPRME